MTRWTGRARDLAGKAARRLFRRQVAINRSVCGRLDTLERIAPPPTPDLQPVLDRLAALERRQEAVEDRADQSLALGWDYAALVRRLARIEDRLEAIEAQREAVPPHSEGWAA
jgi:hypothetical protein